MPKRSTTIFVCESCGYVYRDYAGSGRLKHVDCPSGVKGVMLAHEDDGRELPVEDDHTHPDNADVWIA
jgi:hypothetical protein